MFSKIKELFFLLELDQRKRLYRLQVLVVLMSIAEVASVLSIGPFMALVGDINQLQGQSFLAEWYRELNFNNTTDFLLLIASCVLGVLVIATCISIFTVWRLSMYAAEIGAVA